MVLKPHKFEPHANNVPRVTDVSDSELDIVIESPNPIVDLEDKSIEELIDLGYEYDPMPNKILALRSMSLKVLASVHETCISIY